MYRSRDRERDRQREKERERRKKGLPAMRDQCLSSKFDLSSISHQKNVIVSCMTEANYSLILHVHLTLYYCFNFAVCSTTLFIGKISKTTSEDELRAELEKYGSIESINVSLKSLFKNYYVNQNLFVGIYQQKIMDTQSKCNSVYL